MQEFFVDRDERGQRLDKYLRRRLPLAPSSFIYKMLRKKNITLQGKKADGSEKVETGDRVVLFLSDETIAKFSFPDEHMDTKNREREKEADTAYHRLTPLLGPSPVLYEDENILIIRKPKGILSQKAAPSNLSMNEWLRGYLQQKGETGNFSPAVCNRLDRNTGGILLCARSLQGSRDLSALIRDRKIIKTYTMAVHGSIGKPGRIDAGLVKDRTRNQVRTAEGGGMRAVTVYRPIQTGRLATLTEADLITGRSHQLRVHMASIGHPIVGDPRYGDPALDRRLLSRFSRQGHSPVPSSFRGGQLLWCTSVTFPRVDDCVEMQGVLRPVAGRKFVSPAPEWWTDLCRYEAGGL